MWSGCVPDARRVVRCDARARMSLTRHTTLVDVENAKPDIAHHQLNPTVPHDEPLHPAEH